ncbi:hypothetical protein AVEN_100398-1 [Araneus ventricosus]|uniref:Uncharacterized protein n=1 Tax=Araneus ventricosus TaxID=182803 RepID=A0A4Y2NF42_ARAVE|nr:hypothetical protein AVEN_100398-1 [Araneus ventricosus]
MSFPLGGDLLYGFEKLTEEDSIFNLGYNNADMVVLVTFLMTVCTSFRRVCKLKYAYTLTKMESKPSLEDKDEDIIGFFVFVKDTDTVVLNYNPLYGTWELFGYIGGLVGCWLGISVWALVGIMEKFAKKVVRFLQKLRKKSEEV